ncbi:MAG: ComEC/Rec2 family competence protein, partial [Clostridia bacterium]|nr:ComEC/Rec2 family competence protein [Clostridia bacterium]
MRRPVTAVAAAEAAGIAAAYYIHLNLKHLCILCIGACFVVQLVYKLEKRGRFGLSKGSRAGLLLCCTIAFMLGAVLMNRVEAFESPLLAAAEESPGTASEVRGVPVSVTAKNGYFSLIVKTSDKISGRAEKVLVKLETTEEDTERVFAMAGRSCVFSGPAEAPDGRRNFGCFDYRLYLKSRGIRSICTVSRYRAAAGPVVNPYLNFLSVRKGQFYVSARKYMEESRFSLLAALLFGDKGYMDDGVYEEFQSNGIAHVLAVSGLHVSMVYGLLLKLLDNRRNIYTSSVIAFSLACYICLANFSVSVLRAAFMIFLRLIAFHIKRRYDLVSAAAAVCLVFMTANPYSIFDSGFQLSYMAAFSMGVILPWMELKATELADKRKKGWIKDISDVLSPCIAVQIGMTPLILFHFLVMSPVSFILNPFAVFTAGILMPAGLIFFALDAAGIGIISAAAAGPAAFFAGVLLQINRIGSLLGGSWSFPAPPLGVIAVYYGFVFFFFSEARYMMRRMGRRAALNAVCLALAVTAVLVPKCLKLSDGKYPWQYDSRFVTFLDVGQGDCTHISSDGFNILV